MSESTTASASNLPNQIDRSPAAPLFLWLVIQLVALSLGVFRVPLAARFPPPGEQFAIHIVLTVQVIAAGMLFPFLLRDVTTSAMVILSIAPFVQLASYMSDVPMSRAAAAGGYVAVWLAILMIVRPLLKTRHREMLGVACAVAYSVGVAIIWYVHAETRGGAPIDWSYDGLLGPILGVIAQVEASSPPLSSWIEMGVLLTASFVARFAMRNRSVGESGSSLKAP